MLALGIEAGARRAVYSSPVYTWDLLDTALLSVLSCSTSLVVPELALSHRPTSRSHSCFIQGWAPLGRAFLRIELESISTLEEYAVGSCCHSEEDMSRGGEGYRGSDGKWETRELFELRGAPQKIIG